MYYVSAKLTPPINFAWQGNLLFKASSPLHINNLALMLPSYRNQLIALVQINWLVSYMVEASLLNGVLACSGALCA